MDEYFNATQAIDFSYGDSVDDKDDRESYTVVAVLEIINNLHGCSGSYKLQNGENIVGRSASCAVHINSKTLSKQHAAIEISGDSCLVYDLGSTNKTRKGKIVLKPDVRYSIENGDILTFADIECKFTVRKSIEANSDDTASETGSESMFVAESTASDPEIASKRAQNKDAPTPEKLLAKSSLLVEETPAPKRESRDSILVPESQQANDSGLKFNQSVKKSWVEDSLEGDLHLSMSFNESGDINESKTLDSNSTKDTTAVYNSILMQPTQPYILSSSDTENEMDEALLNAETQPYEEPPQEKRNKLSLSDSSKGSRAAQAKYKVLESSDEDADDELDKNKQLAMLRAAKQLYESTSDEEDNQKSKLKQAGEKEAASNVAPQTSGKLSQGRRQIPPARGRRKNGSESSDETLDDDADKERHRMSLLMAATQPYVEETDRNELTKSKIQSNRVPLKNDTGQNKQFRISKKLQVSKAKGRNIIEDDSTTENDTDDDQNRMDLLMAATQAYVDSTDEDGNSKDAMTVDLMAETQVFDEPILKGGVGKNRAKNTVEESATIKLDSKKLAADGSRLNDGDSTQSENKLSASVLAAPRPHKEENELAALKQLDISTAGIAQTLVLDEPEPCSRSQKKVTVKVDTKGLNNDQSIPAIIDKSNASTPPKGKSGLSQKKKTMNKASPPLALLDSEAESTDPLLCPTQPYQESDSENASKAPIDPTLLYKPSLDEVEEPDAGVSNVQKSGTSEMVEVPGCEPMLAYPASLDDVAEEEETLESKGALGGGRRSSARRKVTKKGTPGPSRTTKKKGMLASVLSSSSIESSQESIREAEGIRLAVDRLLDGPLKSSQEDTELQNAETDADVKTANTANSLDLGSADTQILSDSSLAPELEVSNVETEQKSLKTKDNSDYQMPDAPTVIGRITRLGRKNLKTSGEPAVTVTPTNDSKPKRGRRTAAKEIQTKSPQVDDAKNEEESLSATRSRRPRVANKRFADNVFLTETEKKTVTPEPTIAKGGRRGRKSGKESGLGEAIGTTLAAVSSSTVADGNQEAISVSKTPSSKLKLANVKGKHVEPKNETEALNNAVPKIVIRREAGQQDDNGVYTVTAIKSPKKQTEAADVTARTPRSSRKRATTTEPNVKNKEENNDIFNKSHNSKGMKNTEVSSPRKNVRNSTRTSGKSGIQVVEDLEELVKEDAAAVDQELNSAQVIPRTPRRRTAAKDTTETPRATTGKQNARRSKLHQLKATSSDGGNEADSDKELVLSPRSETSSKKEEPSVKVSPRRGRTAQAATTSGEKGEVDVLSERASRRGTQKTESKAASVQIPASTTQKSRKLKKGQVKDVLDDGDFVSDNNVTVNHESKVENGRIVGNISETKEGSSTPRETLPKMDSPTKRPSSQSGNRSAKRLKKGLLEETAQPSSGRPSRSRSSSVSSASAEATTSVETTPKSGREKRNVASSNANAEVEMPPPATTPVSASKGRGYKNKRDSSAESARSSPTTSIPSPKKRTRTPEVDSSPHRMPRKCTDVKVSIMFTGLEDDKAAAIATRLGGNIVDSVTDCTHLITDKVRRTFKFLCTVARGRPIVTCDWLYRSNEAGCFLDPTPFLIRDPTSEKQYKFKLSDTLKAAKDQPLLDGLALHVTTNVLPEPSQMKLIIQCAGGEIISRMPIAKDVGKKVVVISCAKDLKRCAKIAGEVPVVSAECILTGILQHKFDLNAYPLL